MVRGIVLIVMDLEAAGKSLIIIGNSNNSIISYAKEFLGWTNKITVFIQDNHHLNDSETTEAKRLSLLSKTGKIHYAQVLFYHMGYNIQNELAKQLGYKLDEGFIKTNEKHQTTITNVYAAGDIDTDRHYVVFAVASGAVAAISIYEDILKQMLEN